MTALSQCPVSLSRSRDSCEEIDHRVPNICHVVFTPEQRASSPLRPTQNIIFLFSSGPLLHVWPSACQTLLCCPPRQEVSRHEMFRDLHLISNTQTKDKSEATVGGRCRREGCQAGSVPPPAPQPALHKQIANHLCQYGAGATIASTAAVDPGCNTQTVLSLMR